MLKCSKVEDGANEKIRGQQPASAAGPRASFRQNPENVVVVVVVVVFVLIFCLVYCVYDKYDTLFYLNINVNFFPYF